MFIYALLDKKSAATRRLRFEASGGTSRIGHARKGKSYSTVFILTPTQVI
jgi:hypothetical protein